VRIRKRSDALHWLRLRAGLDERRKKLERSIANINAAVIAYYERNNKIELTDPENGTRWQKRQGSSQFWNDEELKKLLQRKRVPEELVFHTVVKEERDDKALFQLMQDGILTLDDIESVSQLQYHKAYIVGIKKNATQYTSEED
jgi:hypothetical protein